MSTEIWNSTMNELITEISCSDEPVYNSSRILIIALTNIIGEEAFLDDQLKNIWLVKGPTFVGFYVYNLPHIVG